MVNFVIGFEIFGICLNVIALILLLNGEGAKEQKLLLIIMCGSLVQNVGYLLELTASTLEAAMTALTVENVGSAFLALCYCWFIYIYCYITPPKTLLRILFAISFFTLPSVFFNWHGLFYKEVQWIADANGFIMSVSPMDRCMWSFCSVALSFPISFASMRCCALSANARTGRLTGSTGRFSESPPCPLLC